VQIPTHIAAGYIVSKVLVNNLPETDISLITKFAVFGSLAPDVDGLFGKQVKDHRKTPFHAPLVWLLFLLITSLVAFFAGARQTLVFILAFSLGALSHLFLDWFSGRTTGIRIFYPFSKKQYSLFPIEPEKGAFSIFPIRKNLNKYLEFERYCLKNKFLVLAEIIIILTAVLFWLRVWRL
jgi:hypothetical protein